MSMSTMSDGEFKGIILIAGFTAFFAGGGAMGSLIAELAGGDPRRYGAWGALIGIVLMVAISGYAAWESWRSRNQAARDSLPDVVLAPPGKGGDPTIH